MLNVMLATNGGSIALLVVMGVLIVALIGGNFFMQKKQKKKAQETMSKMKVGDTVVTIGGVKGTIVQVNEGDDTIVIETGIGDNKTTITFFKGAIQTVNPDAANRGAAPSAPAEDIMPAEGEAAEANTDDNAVAVEEDNKEEK